jgi:phenylpropionate dioxygenase-like ring-hydroxylating dioxygenase large terminal subunit
MLFLRNAWYVVGWAENLAPGPSRIKVLGESVALYRRQNGDAVALADRCPHRSASLGDGGIVDDVLQCPYHGLRFDANGMCVHNPHGNGSIPPRARVKKYPLVERHHALWIWMGETANANPDLIPDFSLYDGPNLVSSRGYLRINANYELINDNLLDLSHAAFIHPFLTNEGYASRSRSEVKQEGTTVWSYLWNDNEPLTPLFRMVWDGEGDRCDMRAHMRWTAPSALLLDVGVTNVGAAPEAGPALPSAHLLTPESETSTHYFWMVGRNRRREDRELGDAIHAGIQRTFVTEDEPMIARVAENMGGAEFWSLRPAILPGDAAALRARRMLEELIANEVAQRVQQAS